MARNKIPVEKSQGHYEEIIFSTSFPPFIPPPSEPRPYPRSVLHPRRLETFTECGSRSRLFFPPPSHPNPAINVHVSMWDEDGTSLASRMAALLCRDGRAGSGKVKLAVGSSSEGGGGGGQIIAAARAFRLEHWLLCYYFVQLTCPRFAPSAESPATYAFPAVRMFYRLRYSPAFYGRG
jgi:hypothetical protein